jgi:WD40 repeat protein
MAGHDDYITDLSFSPDGRQLATASHDQTVRIWNIFSGAEVWRTDLEYHIGAMGISPDGRRAVVNARYGLYLIDLSTGEVLNTLIEHSFGGIIMGPSQEIVSLIDLETQTIIRQFGGHNSLASAATISPDGSLLATVADIEDILLWDIETQMLLSVVELEGGSWGADVLFTPDGGELIVSEGFEIIVRDVPSLQAKRALVGHTMRVRELDISHDGQWLASTAEDGQIIIWDLATGVPARRFNTIELGGALEIKFTPDDRFVLSGGWQRSLTLWRIHDTPADILEWARHNRYVRNLTCAERQLYGLEACAGDGTPPDTDPWPSTDTDAASTQSVSITRTPYPTPLYATFVPTPTVTPQPSIELQLGVAVTDSLRPRQPEPDTFSFAGAEGQTIVIKNNHMFGLPMAIYDPNGELIEEANATLGPVTLPVDGVYTITVSATSSVSGSYQLVVEEVVE